MENPDLELISDTSSIPKQCWHFFVCFKNKAHKVYRVSEFLATLAELKRSIWTRLTRNPPQISRDKETIHLWPLWATAMMRYWKIVCVSVCVCERMRIGRSIGKYCTHVFACASNDLFVRHKFLLIKWCVHNQGDREKKLCSQGYYGKPSITSPRPNNNLTVAVTLVFGGVTVGIFGCLVNSLASINSMVSEVNLAVPLKYI